MSKETLKHPSKIVLRGFFASLIAALIYISLILIPTYAGYSLVLGLTLLFNFTLETLMLILIYSAYKTLRSKRYIFTFDGKVKAFIRGYRWYIMLNAFLQIGRSILIILLALNLTADPNIIANLMYLIELFALTTLIPFILYLIIWGLMIHISLREFEAGENLRRTLIITSSLMIIVVFAYISSLTAGQALMTIAFLAQAYFFLEASKIIQAKDDAYIKVAKKSKNKNKRGDSKKLNM